jgi:hypothetical protein
MTTNSQYAPSSPIADATITRTESDCEWRERQRKLLCNSIITVSNDATADGVAEVAYKVVFLNGETIVGVTPWVD